MPKYRYRALDVAGEPVFGELDAPGIDEAIRHLAGEGLRVEPSEIAPAAPPSVDQSRLTEEEAAEVAAQVAELAKVGLPLGPGLRAVAQEWPARRTSRMLLGIAAALDAGSSLEDAIAIQRGRFPLHLRGLVLAGVKCGQLPEMLNQYVTFQRDRADLRRRIWMSMAYPMLLLLLVLVLFLFFSSYVVPQFEKIFRDFDADLPQATVMLLAVSRPGIRFWACVPAFALYVLLLLSTTRVPVWGRRVFYQAPLLGPLWRLGGMVSLARLLGLLVEARVPLAEALRYTAEGLGEPDLAVACLRAAGHCARGRSLGDAMTRSWQFLPTLTAFAAWGEQNACLPEALRAAADVFERRLQVAIRVFDNMLPPILLVIIVGSVLFMVVTLFLPLLSLITKLSG